MTLRRPQAFGILTAVAALFASAAAAQTYQTPPPPTRWVTDNAGFISAQTRQQLDARLQQYERDTGHQVVVWIGTTTGGVPLEEWAVRTFETWGIGKKGKDDGVGIFVFAQDRKLRIEVGYGLEGDLPDAYASQIIEEQAVPRLRAGDRDGAVAATVDSVLRRLGGETSPPPPMAPARPRPAAPELGPGQLILFGIVGFLLLILFITHPRLAFFLLYSIMTGGRGGGGGFGGGGGGFRGGGGRSGGGGASGSW